MSAGVLRAAGVAVGVLTALAGGQAAGGWWWLATVAAIVGVLGSLSDRQLGHLVVFAALALTAGVVGAHRSWMVPVIAAGVVGSFELLAAADRVTVVRPTVAVRAEVARSTAIAAAISAAVLVLGAATTGAPVLAVAVAAAAATVALRVVAR